MRLFYVTTVIGMLTCFAGVLLAGDHSRRSWRQAREAEKEMHTDTAWLNRDYFRDKLEQTSQHRAEVILCAWLWEASCYGLLGFFAFNVSVTGAYLFTKGEPDEQAPDPQRELLESAQSSLGDDRLQLPARRGASLAVRRGREHSHLEKDLS